MIRVFIIRPFGTKEDSAKKKLNFDRVQEELIDPALKATGLGGGTTGEIIDSGNIREDMFALILEADLVICDISILNVNVFYELGIRHALRKRATILIKGGPTADSAPFDIKTDRYLYYNIDNPDLDVPLLIETIEATLKSDRETDSPIFKLLPMLPEVDLTAIQVVPLDFREEVERARSAKSKGWLRLLSEEVQARRFKRAGLQMVAHHQWAIKDYEGAHRSYDKIREIYPNDVDANMALATIYERLYRRSPERLVYLEASEQAIERVLKSSRDRTQRVEAFSLQGRNEKTRWRQRFSQAENDEQRRKLAMHPLLWRVYKAYRTAFLQDLNHFYSGIAALQAGFIFSELSEDSDEWQYLFDNDREARYQKEELEEDLKLLRANIQLAIDTALEHLSPADGDFDWAKLSKADLLFLTENQALRALRQYEYAVSRENPFVWDAAKGQLLLFKELGIKTELVDQIISKLDTPAEDRPPKHIILFAGHRIDTSPQLEARFPQQQEEKAKKLIKEKLQSIRDENDETLALASAAPGADILFHELCDELGITSQLCLPMPSESFSRLAFKGLPDWQARYLDLYTKRVVAHTVLELSDREDLPNWLHGSDLNPWERGNSWVLKMAQAEKSSPDDKVSLIVLWDNKPQNPDFPGGTAHMWDIAEEKAGDIFRYKIDSNQLLQ